MRIGLNSACIALLGLTVAGCTASEITTRSLLTELTDLSAITEYPNPPFTCKQFSSYDRKSVTADDHDAWFANADCGQYLRVEERDGRKEHVMVDVDGPGAIVRIWSANPKGTLRIYLDHSETPVIEAPLADVLSGKFAGIPLPIAHTVSAGWNCYFPIPYAQHCKITSDEGGFYYHVNYRTYPAETRVVSFKPADLTELAGEVAVIAEQLATPEQGGEAVAAKLRDLARIGTDEKWVKIGPGESELWRSDASQSGAIAALRVRVRADDMESALRQLVLRIAFDGDETVRCPLGDFFGAAPGLNTYASLPVGVTGDGEMWSHWVMPFEKSVRLSVENHGKQPVEMWLRMAGMEREWTSNSMHFHAKWRTEFDVPTRPMQDWNYLTAKGRGVFVGAAFHIANPVKNWWGEGDEKIFVDGEEFPSHFGTGTEDYYGYAWCSPRLFTHAYHNQPRCDGPGNYGHTAVNRWHVIDRIPFAKDFKFDMELWHWHAETKVGMSIVSYWYSRPGATDEFPPIDPADLRVTQIEKYVAPRVKGALEGEEMKILAKTGAPGPQEWGGLSNEKHLWWRQAKVGDKLVLGFDVEKAGKYRVFARFLTAGDYGIHQLTVNDQPAGEPIDLYNQGVKPSKERELGTFELVEGQNRLTVEVVGANEKAAKSYMFGLDYLRLEVVE